MPVNQFNQASDKTDATNIRFRKWIASINPAWNTHTRSCQLMECETWKKKKKIKDEEKKERERESPFLSKKPFIELLFDVSFRRRLLVETSVRLKLVERTFGKSDAYVVWTTKMGATRNVTRWKNALRGCIQFRPFDNGYEENECAVTSFLHLHQPRIVPIYRPVVSVFHDFRSRIFRILKNLHR